MVDALLVVDTGQAALATRNPAGFVETNPLLGPHPTASNVISYMAAMAVVHAAVAAALPPSWRDRWHFVWMAVEWKTVIHNFGEGLP